LLARISFALHLLLTYIEAALNAHVSPPTFLLTDETPFCRARPLSLDGNFLYSPSACSLFFSSNHPFCHLHSAFRPCTLSNFSFQYLTSEINWVSGLHFNRPESPSSGFACGYTLCFALSIFPPEPSLFVNVCPSSPVPSVPEARLCFQDNHD